MHPVDLLVKLDIYTAQMIFFIRTGEYFWMTQCVMPTHWRTEAWEVSFWSKSQIILIWGYSVLLMSSNTTLQSMDEGSVMEV